MFATFSSIPRIQSPSSVTCKQPLSSTDIAALQANIQSNFTVAFSYSGNEYDYDVTITGSTDQLKRAVSTLYTKNRYDILIQKSRM